MHITYQDTNGNAQSHCSMETTTELKEIYQTLLFWQLCSFLMDANIVCWLFASIFNEKFKLLLQDLIVLSQGVGYLPLMAGFDATNGLLRGWNNSSHLGPATFPVAPNMQTHSLCFNKSPRHHRQHSTAVRCLWEAPSEVLPLRLCVSV